MELMQPIATAKITPNSDWMYEVKYDGFRVLIIWTTKQIKIISRNHTDLTKNFPEIIIFCKQIQPKIVTHLPLRLDGELVVLNNKFQANFAAVQQRGRLKSSEKITLLAKNRPATFIAFDLVQNHGNKLEGFSYLERRRQLFAFFKLFEQRMTNRLQLIDTYESYDEVAQIIFEYKGEGVIAKRKASTYTGGKKQADWLKEKNWRMIHVFLPAYDPRNGYFQTAVFDEEEQMLLGKCKHGLTDEEADSLTQLFMTNGDKQGQMITLPPAICAAVHTLDIHAKELREPEFAQLLPETSPSECTKERLQLDLAMFPIKVDISNQNKIFWPQSRLTKGDLLIYMRDIYPYFIPYVKNRALTVIRCPDGVEEESFFQKNIPSYAPDFIEVIENNADTLQLCNNLESLIWYANHGAIEYHIPYQTVDSFFPIEIVFDLDPPNRESFSLAVQAAKLMKQILDELELISFIKTSGKKGLQIHVPVPPEQINYEETAIFTEAIAKTIEHVEPTLFTTERMKKNRGERLYIDYVQHGKNKTIITPYSPRKTAEGTVATPLDWSEVTENLHPEQFTIETVVRRVQTIGCPWLFHYEEAREQKLTKFFQLIQS